MAERPQNLHTSKSFTRLEAAQAKNPLSRSRASTLQGPPVPVVGDPLKIILPREEDEHVDGDVFATKSDGDDEPAKEAGVPDSFEELPIEIRSLTERYGSEIVFKTASELNAIGSSNRSPPKSTRARCPPMPSPTSSRTFTRAPQPRSVLTSLPYPPA
jgi:hypothetical protein